MQDGEAAVSALAKPFRMTLRGLLKHVGVLEAAGLVITRKQGRTRIVRLHPDGLVEAIALIDALRGSWPVAFDPRAAFIDLDNVDVT